MTKVSIIVPNYNHAAFLKERLDSILNQTFQDFELILLDDASTDGSVAILNTFREHPKVSHLLMNTENSGSPFRQWQRGIKLAKGTYIWIAESDDYAHPSFLEQTVKQLDGGAHICYVQSEDVDDNGRVLSNRIDYTGEFDPNIWQEDFTMPGGEFLRKYLLVKNVIPNASGVLFRRSLIKDSIFTQELLDMRMCGDWFFWIQLCPDHTISFVSDTLNSFRIHAGVTRKHKDIQKKKQRILEEVSCRNFMMKTMNVSHSEKNKVLIEHWSELHSKWAPFSRDFYKFKPLHCGSICLFLKFLRVKLTAL